MAIMRLVILKGTMKKINSNEFYTKSWSDREEIVIDENNIVFHRRKDEELKDTFYTSLSKHRDNDEFSKPRPSKYKYDNSESIMCKCGNKEFTCNYGCYELFITCTKCGVRHLAYDG